MNTDRHITEILRLAAAQLEAGGVYCGHGTDNVTDEAFWLLCHALELSVHDALPDVYLDAGQQQQVNELVAQRIDSRRPAAYLTGSTWFAGLPFLVSSDVLVPRSPLAELIQNKFAPWLNAAAIGSVLDLGTGSGCIAIACANFLPGCNVTGSDVSLDALALAARNADQLGLGERCRWLESDVYAGLQQECFDLIISNPPYVPDARRETLAPEYLAEPDLGLYSGADGLDHAARILMGASRHLQPGGHLLLEIGESAAELQNQLPMIPFIWPDFERGGEGVLIADRGLLEAHEHDITRWCQHRKDNG